MQDMQVQSLGQEGSRKSPGRSPEERDGNPLQYSCLENPVDRGAWQATVHGITRVGHDLATKQQQQQQTRTHNEEISGGFLTGFVKKL